MKTQTIRQQRKRWKRQISTATREAVHETGLEWTDWDLDVVRDMSSDLAIRADSFKTKLLFNVQPWYSGGVKEYVRSPRGSWAYINSVVYRPVPHFGSDGHTFFDGPVIIPVLRDLRLSLGVRLPESMPEQERLLLGAVWMSVTPAEMISQSSGIRRAKGKVLVGGLGLGWFLEQVCNRDDVDEVVVVERSQELLDWYGYRLCRNHDKVRDVICDDVYAVVDRFPDHQLLLDIWPTYGGDDGAEGDERLAALRKTAGDRVWAWGMD
jgi:hypothetical protein